MVDRAGAWSRSRTLEGSWGASSRSLGDVGTRILLVPLIRGIWFLIVGI